MEIPGRKINLELNHDVEYKSRENEEVSEKPAPALIRDQRELEQLRKLRKQQRIWS
jgi:hypothetical protein